MALRIAAMTLDPSGDGCRILRQLCDDFSALPANLTAVMRTGDTLQSGHSRPAYLNLML